MMGQHVYPMRIHFEDTDCTGIVFHSNYLNFMERGRSMWIEELGMGLDWQREHKILFVVHSASLKYLAPARVHDKVEVVSRVNSIRQASIIFDQYLRSAGTTDKIVCKAEIKLACLNQNMQPCAFPPLNFR